MPMAGRSAPPLITEIRQNITDQGAEMTVIQLPDRENCCCTSAISMHTLLTLPVAPCSFSRIRFDPIDSPVRAVPPAGALNWLDENLQQGAKITAVDLDGPGDPLCEIDCTMETLHLIRNKYPDIELSVTTLGLHAQKYSKLLSAKGVTGVTLLVDAVDKKVAEKLYAWIRPGRKTIPLAQATELLMHEQPLAVKFFQEAGCKVSVRSTVYPEINDDHIQEIARAMAAAGAETITLVPFKSVASKDDQLLSPPDFHTMQRVEKSTSQYLKTFRLVEKANYIGFDCSSSPGAWCKSIPTLQPNPTKSRPNIAVVSLGGMEVDLHLGQAYQVLIYGPREDGLTCLLGTRPVPDPGSGSSRWEDLAASLDDCFALLASSAGESPRRILGQHGITVLIIDNEIEGTVDLLFGGGKKGKCKKNR